MGGNPIPLNIVSTELSGKVSYTFEHKSYSQEKKRFENE